MNEIVSKEYEPFYSIVAMSIDASPMIVYAIYFYYVQDMEYLVWFNLAF
jgi:hypothetical protein